MATLTFTADEAKYMASVERLIQQQHRMEDGFRRTGKSGQDAGGGMTSAFTSAHQMVGQLAAALGIGGAIAGAIEFLKKGLSDLDRQAASAADRIASTIAGRRALGQVAETPAAFAMLTRTTERARTQFGLPGQEAYDLTFAAASAGLLQKPDHIDLFAQLRDIAFRPEAGIGAVQKIQANWPGTSGDARAILNKILAAAGPSPVKAPEFAEAVSTFATEWAAIRGEDETALAALAALAVPFKSPAAAGERLKSLASTMAKKEGTMRLPAGMEGATALDLIYRLPELAAEGRLLTEGGKKARDVGAWLGEANAVAAYEQLVRQRPAIQAALTSVTAAEAGTGTAADLLARRYAIVRDDPQIASVRFAETHRQRRELIMEPTGVGRQLTEGLIEDLVRDLRQHHSPLRAWGGEKFLESSRWVTSGIWGEEQYARDFAPFASAGTQIELLKQMAPLSAALIKMGEGFARGMADMKAAIIRANGGPTLVPALSDE